MPSLIVIPGPAVLGPFGLFAATSIERRIVRVWFTDIPMANNRNGVNDALNPANWTVTPDPAASNEDAYTTVTVENVLDVPEDDNAVDVVVDLDFSFHINYKVTVAVNVVSDAGWPVAGTSELSFYAHDPIHRERPVARVYDWFGRAAKGTDYTKDLFKMSSIWQDMMEQAKALANSMRGNFDIQTCKIGYLDSRLEYYGFPFTDMVSRLTPNQRRLFALHLVAIYKVKGTFNGILLAISLGLDISCWVWPHNDIMDGLKDTEIGGGLFNPDHPATYPTVPVVDHPDNQVYLGTFELGPGVNNLITRHRHPNSLYRWGSELSEDGAKPHKHYFRLDGWGVLGDGSTIGTYPYTPEGEENPTPPPTYQEKNRRGIYYFDIYLNEVTTALQRKFIRDIANYMKPVNTHLREIIIPAETYDPMILDVSFLDLDWDLH